MNYWNYDIFSHIDLIKKKNSRRDLRAEVINEF